MGKVSAMSRPQIATVISFACFMAHLGRRYHQVSSKRRAVRLVRRIDHLSMVCPSKPNSAGSKVTDKSAEIGRATCREGEKYWEVHEQRRSSGIRRAHNRR